MPTTAPGRRGDATRSGLAQVDAAEDLVAVVAAAVAVNVARSIVHVLGIPRRDVAVGRLGATTVVKPSVDGRAYRGVGGDPRSARHRGSRRRKLRRSHRRLRRRDEAASDAYARTP